MAAFERILIPTDLSDFATLAFKYGVLFNKQVGSKLTLLFVEDVAISFEALEMPLGYYLEEAPQAREVLMEKLRDQARALAPGVSIETAVATDTPSRAIVTLGDQMRADLIIMGTHGRRGLERAFLGSVTERVLRHTDRPILTLTPNRIKLDTDPSVRRILCPVNFTPAARSALVYAAEVANTFHAELVVMHVAEATTTPSLSVVGPALTSWIAPAVGERVRYREIVTHGDAAERVLDTATDLGADLIVMGSQHRFFSDEAVIGTTTEHVTRDATVPVLTVTQKAVTVTEPHLVEDPAMAV